MFGVCQMLIRYILWAQNMSPKISRLVIALFLTGVPFVYTALTAELSETSFFASSLAGTIEDAAVSDFNEIPANKWIRLKTSGNPPAKVFQFLNQFWFSFNIKYLFPAYPKRVHVIRDHHASYLR